MRPMKRPTTCPRCGSTRIVPVIWGYAPDDGLVARGEAIIGGCRLPWNPSPWGCAACGWIPIRPYLVPPPR